MIEKTVEAGAADSTEDNRKIQQNEKGIYFETSILENVEDMAPELVTRINEIASSSFELYQNGLGYNNLLFMSAVLGDMAIERGGVYQHLLLIEEPEAHLHPQLQELVHTLQTFPKHPLQKPSLQEVLYGVRLLQSFPGSNRIHKD